jgi:hypothetical protein
MDEVRRRGGKLHTEVLRDIYSWYIIKEIVPRRMRLLGHTACMWKGEKRILGFVEKVKLSLCTP